MGGGEWWGRDGRMNCGFCGSGGSLRSGGVDMRSMELQAGLYERDRGFDSGSGGSSMQYSSKCHDPLPRCLTMSGPCHTHQQKHVASCISGALSCINIEATYSYQCPSNHSFIHSTIPPRSSQ